MKVRDIMHRKVITAEPDMTLKELASVFIDQRITGAPVVANGGEVIGVISQTDIVRHDREASPEPVPVFHREEEDTARSKAMHLEEPDFTRVRDVMTPGAISVEEDTPLKEVAKLMLRKKLHRVVVMNKGRLSGILTSMDMMKALADLLERPSRDPGGRKD